MREIKFRAWDSLTKQMEYDVERTYDMGCDGGGSLSHDSFADVLDDEKCTVMQYTGLKDKNGKEIYEGDILLEHFGDAYRLTGVVKFSTQDVGSCGCCYDDFRGTGFIAEGIHFHRSEVIGNIYENPELLRDVGKVIK